ncbi:MAG: hypothetical protein HKN01_00180 [Acidimicrobiia bacterium]|nr:hypothetical protein [Acidimicrobiia bacterium]
MAPVEPHIGTLNEGSLHAALKDRYSQPGDEFEVPLGRFVIDIRRPGLLVEIQTGSFGAMGNKLDHLLPEHQILLVYPIAVETYLEREGAKTRKSPKRGSILSLFDELVSIPTLLDHPNLTLDVVLVSVTKVQDPNDRTRRGRGYRTIDRVLREVHETRTFATAADLLALLPDGLPDRFTTANIAELGGMSRDYARRMAYCFNALDFFIEHERTKAGVIYSLASR